MVRDTNEASQRHRGAQTKTIEDYTISAHIDGPPTKNGQQSWMMILSKSPPRSYMNIPSRRVIDSLRKIRNSKRKDGSCFDTTGLHQFQATFHQEFQQRQWLLCTIEVNLGHREVINEDTQFFALRKTSKMKVAKDGKSQLLPVKKNTALENR